MTYVLLTCDLCESRVKQIDSILLIDGEHIAVCHRCREILDAIDFERYKRKRETHDNNRKNMRTD
jgi:ribosome-binding protein aMBF1 (putative translation factor)